MEQIISAFVGIRRKLANSILEYTDPGYQILKKKTVPLSKEER